jgi:pentatricopeptide repeat protein
MNHLAELLMTSGRLSEAEILYRQIVESDSDSDAQSRLASYNSLANVCRQLGRREEAVEWYQRALDMAEMTGRHGDPAVLATCNNLAEVFGSSRAKEPVDNPTYIG